MAESLEPGKRDGGNISSDQPSTSSSSGEGIIIIDSDTSSSDDLDEIEELPNSDNKTFTRQNSRLSIDSVSLSGNDGLEWICVRRLARSTTFRRKKSLDKEKQSKNANDATRGNKKRRKFWSFRFKKRLHGRLQRPRDDSQPKENHPCVCTEIRRTDDHLLGAGIVFSAASTSPQRGTGPPDQRIMASSSSQSAHGQPHLSHAELLQIVPAPPGRSLPPLADEDVGPFEDIDEMLTSRREREMREGIEIPVSEMMRIYPLTSVGGRDPSQVMGATAGGPKPDSAAVRGLTDAFQNLSVISNNGNSSMVQANNQMPTSSGASGATTQGHYSPYRCLMPQNSYPYPHRVHTQVDYIHCLVPDLLKITNCGFYWGVMDRYEAEKLLENRPEGTFLLRDSAQDEFLFSVSFRRYGRSLHARIEQWNHRFSFDSHDPGVFASDSVCGLIEHYKDPCCCMFFEPMLILPLNRTFPFSLQHICRSVICSNLTYDNIELLPLPNSLKDYLKYYHYKQKVRVRRFDCMPY